MIWNDLPLESVITRNLFYFDESKKDTCERICKKLEIDCFPDLSKNKFWIFEDDVWKPNEINYKLTEIYNPFDIKLLDLYERNHSNIAFVSSNSFIDGIIHFTNYDNENVFSNLYRNLHIFEKNLRSFLYLFDVDINTLIGYYNYQIKRKKKNHDVKMLEVIEILDDVKNPLQEICFSDLLCFSVSSYNREMAEKIGLNKLNIKASFGEVIDLRNTIMHHKEDSVTGKKPSFLHDFETFKNFFIQVLLFKEMFSTLSISIAQDNLGKRKKENIQKLTIFDKMSDSEIKKYFYTNY